MLNFEGCSTFSRNSARLFGGGVNSQDSTLKFIGNTNFSSNSVLYNGGGIHGMATALFLTGISCFTANTAGRGGGEYLVGSKVLLSKNSTVIMNNNSAMEYGGALYVEDPYLLTDCASNISIRVRCHIQTYELLEIPHFTNSNLTSVISAYFNIRLHFYNNRAQISGSAVYGGSLDICRIHVSYKFANSLKPYYKFLNYMMH